MVDVYGRLCKEPSDLPSDGIIAAYGEKMDLYRMIVFTMVSKSVFAKRSRSSANTNPPGFSPPSPGFWEDNL
jgi:hypothetical protein